MIRTLAIVAAVWCVLSVLFAICWSRFMFWVDAGPYSVVGEAERVLDVEFERMWGL